MPIGIVSDDDFLHEINSLSPQRKESHPPSHVIQPSQVQIIDKPSRGRSDGDVNVPDSLRQIIGEDAVINGRSSATQLARQFGISPSSVSAYANGASSTTTYHEAKPSIIQHINKSRQRAIKRASKTLNAALGSITQEKLDYADVTDLSGIAKDMSVIIKNLEPPPSQSSDQSDNKTPQFVIFAPQFRDERSFEVIKVQE
jgi:DNA-binding transcriptional regulator YdaS (Cro superfamily)